MLNKFLLHAASLLMVNLTDNHTVGMLHSRYQWPVVSKRNNGFKRNRRAQLKLSAKRKH